MKNINRKGILDTSLRFIRNIGISLLLVNIMSTTTYADDDPFFLLHNLPSFFPGGGNVNEKGNTIIPPEDDPSHFGELDISDLEENLPEANEGALEGGFTETIADTHEANVLQAEDQRDDGTYNVPTNGPPSPLYGATAFSQQILRFEEFGTQRLNLRKKHRPLLWRSLPTADSAQGTPDSVALDRFLSQPI